MEILLQKGANVNLQDESLSTPLYYALPNIAKLLLEYSSNLDLCVRDNEGNTVFESFLDDEYLEIMKMIAFHHNLLP